MSQKTSVRIALRLLLGFLLAAGLAPACDGEDPGTQPELVSQSKAAEAPAIGQADSQDGADRSCSLVMRNLDRLRNSDGELLQACDEQACHFVWEGDLDVASQALADGASVGVLYHLQGSSDWWQVSARPVGPGNPGFVRMRFRMDDHLPGPDLDDEALLAAAFELIPFVQRADGARLFDHNRLAGDFDNYEVRGDQGFYLAMEPTVCNHRPDTAALQFTAGWSEFPQGDPRAGGRLAIHYDLDRLPDCRQAPGWDVQAFVQVDSDGPLLSGSLVARDDEDEPYAWPLLLSLPADARALSVWFEARSADGSCTAYDSDYGRNYAFELGPDASSVPCAGTERWEDKYGGQPACPDYQIDAQVDATNCEFALDGIGDGYEGHYGIPYRWLEARLWIGQTEGELLEAGMYVAYQDLSDATSGQRWILGQRTDDGSFQTGFNYLYTGYMGDGSYRYVIERFAFFLDVRRPSGLVERLWQSRQGADYTWADAFGLPTDTQYIPYGRVEWANRDAPIFEPLGACR